jgi:hypothetical protein
MISFSKKVDTENLWKLFVAAILAGSVIVIPVLILLVLGLVFFLIPMFIWFLSL